MRIAVVEALRGVTVEDSDVVTRGWVRGVTATAEKLSVELELPAGFAFDQAEDVAKRCEQAAEAVRDALATENIVTKDCLVDVEASLPREGTTGETIVEEDPLRGVKKIVAVSSCKGGVGKSTVAVNLACAWAEQGLRVGICDVDVYGPSLPTLMGPLDDPSVRTTNANTELLVPFEKNGLKLMSFGYLNPEAAMMRGSRVAGVVDQLATRVDWGDLDILVLDTPPGTGDAQLTLCQNLKIDAAVVVTTPSRLAFADVVKGIQLFDTVDVPVVAVVENMAGLKPSSPEKAKEDAVKFLDDFGHDRDDDLFVGGQATRDQFVDALARFMSQPRRPFGDGHKRQLSEMWGLENFVEFDLSPDLAKRGDDGTPLWFVNERSIDEDIAMAGFRNLASRVSNELTLLDDKPPAPDISFDGTKILIDYAGTRSQMSPVDLRLLCRCALCVADPPVASQFDPQTYAPAVISKTGNYAVAVTWSDGHQSLFPFKSFVPNYSS